MKYYSVGDIVSAYKLTRDALMYRIRSGKLKAEKLLMRESRTPKNFKYIIPETELASLAEFKVRDPVASENAQPDYYDKLWQEKEIKQKQQAEYWAEERRKREEERRKFSNYYDYMHSSEWQAKRMQRIKLDGFRCQMCGSGMHLQVHHVCYDNLCKDAEIDDLVTLCKSCHEKVHAIDLRRKNPLSIFEEDEGNIPYEERNRKMFYTALRLLRDKERTEGWPIFERACQECTPPLTAKETAEIWLSAIKQVFPL